MKAASKQIWLIILTLSLAACNGGGGSSSSKASIAENKRPVANAGADIVVTEQQLATLDGSNSYDEDGDTITYKWSQTSGPTVTLSSDSDNTPSFIAPEGEEIISYQLTINDGKDISIADTITITVVSMHTTPDPSTDPSTDPDPSINLIPLADAGDNQSVSAGQFTTLDGSQSSDPENNDLTYIWTQTEGEVVSLNSHTIATPSFTSPESEDNLSFTLTVNDGLLDSIPSTVSVLVASTTSVNQKPVAHAGDNQTVNGNDTVVLDSTQSLDANGDSLTYLWQQVNGDNVFLNDHNVDQPYFTAPEEGGTFTFSLVVNDGLSDSDIDEVIIEVLPINPLLAANAGEDQTVKNNILVTLNGANSTTTGDSDLSYIWEQTGGPSVIMSSTSVINPNFTSPDLAVDSSDVILSFSLFVSNGSDNSAKDSVNITVNNKNLAPTAAAGDNQTVNVDTTVTLNGSLSSDPENESLSYSWSQTSGPSITLSATDVASPSFVAPPEDATINFSLIVNDGLLASNPDVVSITVEAINQPPIANAGVDRFVGSLSVVALKGINSYDPEEDIISYQWSQISGPSANLSDANIANPVFSANTDGPLIFSLSVSDGELISEADTVNVTVGPIPVTNTKVNGTGIIWGANYPTGNNLDCMGETIEQQDCSLGRDQTHNDDDDGRAGFSYSKIDPDGIVVDSTEVEWDCVQDNVTGLMWEVKKGGNDITGDEGITDADDRFSWYNSDASSNGGDIGFIDSGGEVCHGYNEEDNSSYCNTQSFSVRMNEHALCGYADWRLPTRKELLTLIDYGQDAPMIESDYFPSPGEVVWAGTPLALGSSSAWIVNFDYGNSFSIDRRNARKVRLVRAGY